MIRHESVITALIGGVLGIALGIVLGGSARRARRLHRLLAAGHLADRLRHRSDRRRHPRRDLPGASRRAAERPRGAAVRVTDVVELLRAYVASDDRARRPTAARCCASQRSSRGPLSRDEVAAHFTASAFVVDETGERVCLVAHAKLGRLLQPGGHVEPTDRLARGGGAARGVEETALELELHPTAPRPFDLDVHEIPERRASRRTGTSTFATWSSAAASRARRRVARLGRAATSRSRGSPPKLARLRKPSRRPSARSGLCGSPATGARRCTGPARRRSARRGGRATRAAGSARGRGRARTGRRRTARSLPFARRRRSRRVAEPSRSATACS